MGEDLDIYDENDNPTGEVLPFGEVHARKLWHRVIDGHVVNSKGEFLLARRAMTTVNNPGEWDCAFGGHVNAGESYLEGAIREAKEEIGLDLSHNDLTFIVQTKSPDKRHHRHSFIVHRDVPLGVVAFNDGEVVEAKYVPWRELAAMSDEDKAAARIRDLNMVEVFEYLERWETGTYGAGAGSA